MKSEKEIEEACRESQKKISGIISAIGNVFVGQEDVVEQVVVALIAGGHVLIEGVPGLGKTLLVKSLAEALDLSFSRIQFTPDLMPADITGTKILHRDEGGHPEFTFQKGPVFANIVLADEINRATPKTQSALLEAMQEHHVTVSGEEYKLDDPFFMLATQNPIEMEGTFPLPEAQLDRFFFKIKILYPSFNDLERIADISTSAVGRAIQKICGKTELFKIREAAENILVSQEAKRFAVKLVLATQSDSPYASAEAKNYIRYGASPRGVQALISGGKVLALRDGRFNLSYDDIRKVALPALRHRILLNFEGEANNMETDGIISAILRTMD
ncbi:MAG: AAA family ATPase [Nitrospirae bacterium]|nr:AAA family ATPase [Nitrospirota bacterium]